VNLFSKYLNNIKSFILGVIDSIKNRLSGLGFGERVRIPITSKETLKEAVNTGIQSKLGYLSEYVTAADLVKLLHANGLNVEFEGKRGGSAVKASTKFKQDYLKGIRADINAMEPKKRKTFREQIKRQQNNGAAMAKRIYNDAIHQSEDLKFLTFAVKLTGYSLKGSNKADIAVEITKDKKKVVVDKIMASLKSYKGWKINVANTTVVSFLDNLGIDLPEDKKSNIKTQQDIRHFIWLLWNAKDPKAEQKITQTFNADVWQAVKPMFEDQLTEKLANPTEEQAGLLQNAYLAYADTFLTNFSNILNSHYVDNREEMNKNTLKLLGFDNSDDFYLAVNTREGVKVLSNRTSESYKKLVESLNTKYHMKFDYKLGNVSSMDVIFKAPDNSELIRGRMAFGKTKATESTKINYFINFISFKGEAK
jgi:hypothetical protein